MNLGIILDPRKGPPGIDDGAGGMKMGLTSRQKATDNSFVQSDNGKVPQDWSPRRRRKTKSDSSRYSLMVGCLRSTKGYPRTLTSRWFLSPTKERGSVSARELGPAVCVPPSLRRTRVSGQLRGAQPLRQVHRAGGEYFSPSSLQNTKEEPFKMASRLRRMVRRVSSLASTRNL